MNITRQKGCKDILPDESILWQYIENEIKEICRVHNIQEIRTPVFEATELYARGVGDETDIVTKEMYTFLDKGNRSITLRPELTAGVVRAYIENGLSSKMTSPVKLWYTGKMYRYEKMQKGRYREFSQFGVEMFGSSSYLADIETIKESYELLKRLNLADKIELTINSIGCKECRSKYIQKLKEYIKPNLDNMCGTCKIRYEKNPLRMLDCKEEKCAKILKDAPVITDFLCEECSKDFENVKNALDNLDIPFWSSKLAIDEYTLEDIVQALKQPTRDYRDDFAAPILRSDILKIENLKNGMKLQGTVRNVVDFGAFVDIGLKNDGLVHISQMSNDYIKHPLDVVSVGDIVDCYVKDINLEKGKVQLSFLEK